MTAPSDERSPVLPHLPALDGLRGVAVALVVAYHLAPTVVPGGFLGVDMFFVLSGFLITSLIVTEAEHRGRVDVPAFYLRRARRLLPALLLLLLAGAVYAATWAPTAELDRLRSHSLWTLGYLANWRFIADGTTYTDAIYGQSPLRHTWSLAIEEQFYIVFPLLVLALGRLVGWRGLDLRRLVAAVAIVGALASAVWMALLWGDGSDPSRGYFGTDTRVHSLLIGVLLGAVLVGRPVVRGGAGRVAAGAALVGSIGLAWAVAVSHEDSAVLRRGGFLLVAVATAAIIAGSERVTPLRRALSVRPLVALGLISYGVYLWHWPVIIVLDEVRTGLDGAALAAVRLAVTLGFAAISFTLVERPIRAARTTRATRRPTLAIASTGVLAVAGLVLVTTAVPPSTTAAPVGPRTASSVPAGLAGSSADLPMGVVMFGDSVAHSLAGGVDENWTPWRPDQSPFDPGLVDLWSVAVTTCSYLDGRLLLTDGRLQSENEMLCGGWKTAVQQVLSRGGYDVVLVALLNDAGDRLVDGHTVELGSEEHREILSRFLDELREVTAEYGSEVVLLALPPRSGDAMTAADLDGRRDRLMRDELVSYAAARPGVRLLDLFEELCPSGDCAEASATLDPAWRPDGLHFSPEGARAIADWITLQLLDTPSEERGTLDASK